MTHRAKTNIENVINEKIADIEVLCEDFWRTDIAGQ